jgi:D-aminopeptidase
VLCGAQPDGEFRPQDARDLIGRTLSTQFAPGHLFSYSNGNFRLLADMLEERTGETLGDMLRRRLWEPAGMEWAQHAPETSRAPGDVVGYEESANGGYIPVTNRIHWSGDAGMVACLDDMIAWEREIDRRREDSGCSLQSDKRAAALLRWNAGILWAGSWARSGGRPARDRPQRRAARLQGASNARRLREAVGGGDDES